VGEKLCLSNEDGGKRDTTKGKKITKVFRKLGNLGGKGPGVGKGGQQNKEMINNPQGTLRVRSLRTMKGKERELQKKGILRITMVTFPRSIWNG